MFIEFSHFTPRKPEDNTLWQYFEDMGQIAINMLILHIIFTLMLSDNGTAVSTNPSLSGYPTVS